MKGNFKRWQHHLNPILTKDKWSNEENRLLFDMHKKFGSKWKQIAACFTQRTDNGIKNQFFSIIRKSLRKACKYCSLPINPSTINTIKPKILSQFVNSGHDQNSIEQKSQEKDDLIQKHPNNEQTAPLDHTNLTINDVVKKFAFCKPVEVNVDFKSKLKELLIKNLDNLQQIK